MILAPNLRLRLNGNNGLPLLLAMLLFSSCELFKPVQTDKPKTTDQGQTLDEIQGRRVYDPETGTYVIIENAPVEKMDTIRWTNVAVDPKQIIKSREETFVADETVTPSEIIGSEVLPGNIKTEYLSNYNVSVVLPFLSDRFSPTAATLPPNSDWALNYYAGVKMALEDLSSEAINMTVSVIDGRETSEAAAAQVIRTNQDLAKSHLIIGPYRPETARILADFAYRYNNDNITENDKVIVSPQTTLTNIVANNPAYVQVNPSLETHCQAITRHARQRYRPDQIVLVCRDKDQEVERLKYFQDENARISGGRNVQRFREYVVADNAEFNNAEMLSLIRFSDTTVFILPSWSNETFIYSFLRKLDLARRENTKIIVYGMPQWMEYEIIDYDYYERLNVHVSSGTYINSLSPDIQFFKRRFFDRYGTVPKDEAYLGYDVMLYFGRMLKKYGTKFQYALEVDPAQMLHTRFDFEREVIPTTTGVERPPIQRFENKYVNILRFQDYQFKLAE